MSHHRSTLYRRKLAESDPDKYEEMRKRRAEMERERRAKIKAKWENEPHTRAQMEQREADLKEKRARARQRYEANKAEKKRQTRSSSVMPNEERKMPKDMTPDEYRAYRTEQRRKQRMKQRMNLSHQKKAAIRSKRREIRKTEKEARLQQLATETPQSSTSTSKQMRQSLYNLNHEYKQKARQLGATNEEYAKAALNLVNPRTPQKKVAIMAEQRTHPTKDGTNMPSTAGVYRFFKRHPQLTLRTPMSLVKERALVTPTNVEKWFAGLQTFLNSKDPSIMTDPTRIFNVDESGFSFNPKQRKVIAWKGVKSVYRIASNTKKQVTVLAAMNAAGFYLPPLIIYPYKRVPRKNLLNGFPEALLQVSENGWITSAIFFTWLRDSFIPATQHIQKPLLLLVDGHISHTSLIETSTICEENGIILYCLLAHASHLLQPLDQAFFGSVKCAWSTASRQQIAETGAAVGLDTFAKVFQTVWQRCSTEENAASSFRAAGIFPLSPERVLQTRKMDPCQVYHDVPSIHASSDQPRPSASNQEPLPPPTSNQEPLLLEVDDDEEPEPPLPSLLPSKFMEEPEPSALVVLPSDGEEPYPAALPPFEDILEKPTCSQITTPSSRTMSTASNHHTTTPSTSSHLKTPTSQTMSTASNHHTTPPSTSSHLTTTNPAPTPSRGSSPVASTFAALSSIEESRPTYTGKQLEAMKDFALFVTDDLGRNGFLRCFQALSRDATETHDGFSEFKRLAASLKSAFVKQKDVTQSTAPLTLEDILRVPSFSGKGKHNHSKKATPTMQYVLSGAEHREAILLKEDKRQREEKEKLAKKTAREEKSRQMKERKEHMRLQREKAKEEKQQRAAELQRQQQERKDQALLEKLEREGQRKRKRSESDDDHDERLEKEMEQTMREADEDDSESEEEVCEDECRE